MATVKELLIKLGLDLDAQSFAKGQLAAHAVEKGLHLIVHAAELVAHSLIHMIEGTIESAVRIDHLSQQLGVGTEQLQRLAYVGKFSGLTIEDMATSLKFMNKEMARTGHGKEDPTVFLSRMADKFAAMPNGAEKSTLAMKVFGRSGLQMIPVLNKGSEAIRELAAEAGVLGPEAIEQAHHVHEAQIRLAGAWGMIKREVSVALLPTLQHLAEWATEWLKHNKAIIKVALHKVFEVLFKVGKALYRYVLKPMGQLLVFLGKHWKLIALIIGSVLAALLPQMIAFGVAALAAGLQAAAGWIAAAAPIILVAALILLALLLIEDFVTMMEGGDSVLGALVDKFKKWLNTSIEGSPILNGIKKIIKTVFEFGDAWFSTWAKIVTYIEGHLERLSSKFSFLRYIPVVYAARHIRSDSASDLIKQFNETVANPAPTYMDLAQRTTTIPVAPASISPLVSSPAHQRNWVEINVTQQPGESQDTLVGKIKEGMSEFFNNRMREAAAGTGH